MKDKIKSITHIQKDESMKVKSIKGKKQNQYLPVAISSAVQGTVKSSEDRISKLLYKNTVELSMVMNVLSAIADVDNDTLKKLRVKCMNEVKATNGKISFEEINKYQKGS